MTNLKAGIVGAIIMAGVATPLVLHYRAQPDLRDKETLLQQQNEQLALLTAENARLSKLVAEASGSAPRDDSRELLRLRGEVGVLKGQLAAAAATRQESAKRLSQSQSKTEVDSAEEQRQIGIAKMNYTKGWAMAFMQYANRNQGQFPINFDQASPFLPDETKGQTNLVLDQFEIVYQGSVNEITNPQSVIVIREKEAWSTLDGGWVKGYSFADGHSEIHKAADGNFQPWEQQHLIPPPQ